MILVNNSYTIINLNLCNSIINIYKYIDKYTIKVYNVYINSRKVMLY